ncbi:YchJ family metal-binding protein [Glaciihabitans sp. UYNi722]|uniref:YchJ family protein n=1 Tax=Glaciihabitans sp. UYNi722 TaxID=3156344 RepID=UPI00339A147B
MNDSSIAWPPADASVRCPCLSGEIYGACCAPIHLGQVLAPTAERLMRSRYTAFVFGNAAYLLDSWHPSTRPSTLELDPGQRWFGLQIIGTDGGRMLDTSGTVEFSARRRQSIRFPVWLQRSAP